MGNKILIVDDDEDLRSELHDLLEGYEVVEAPSGEQAMDLLSRANEIGLVILDVMMPGISGLDVLSQIRYTDPDLAIIILTGHSSKDVAIEALKSHADDYIEKPISASKIKEAVERLFDVKRGEGDISALDAKGKIEKVKHFIERNCFKKTTLKEAADSVCWSPKYLSRIFKEQLKTGFSEYKITIKINSAKELFKTKGYNINQISEKLGYENPESFIRQFKKLTGLTPTKYRNSKASGKKHKRKTRNKKKKK